MAELPPLEMYRVTLELVAEGGAELGSAEVSERVAVSAELDPVKQVEAVVQTVRRHFEHYGKLTSKRTPKQLRLVLSIEHEDLLLNAVLDEEVNHE